MAHTLQSRNMAFYAASALLLGSIALYGFRNLTFRPAAPHRHIRNAGPEAMDLPPEEWDMTDQAIDESFPASDPPGGY